MACPAFVRRFVGVAFVIGALLLPASSLPSRAAHIHRVSQPPASVYRYDGLVYDRLFSALGQRRISGIVSRPALDRRVPLLAGTPYQIADLGALTGVQFESGTPLAIDNAGDITLYDACECNGEGGSNLAYLIHNDGSYDTLFAGQNGYDILSAVPYAINNVGDEAGDWSYVGAGSYFKAHAYWGTPARTHFDPSGADNGSFALAVNDADVSVGQAPVRGVTTAALFQFSAQGGDDRPKALLPPANTKWIGTATGINDAGEIVGYARINASLSRPVRFFLNKTAQVIPVGASGLSSSAQAINQHGDIVGNAGSQAFLYRNNRVTYLPRPPGEEAGDAVAYAINSSDEIVGDIVSPAGETAFLYANGQSYDLDTLVPASAGWVIVSASGINDSGEIIGTGYQPSQSGPLNSGTFEMKPQ